MKRWGTVSLALALLAATLTAAAAAAAPTRPRRAATPVFGDGTWSFTISADLRLSGSPEVGVTGVGDAFLHGDGELRVSGSNVTGAWQMTGPITADVSVPGGGSGHVYADVQVADGIVTGTPQRPELRGTVTIIGATDVTVTAFTTSVPINLSSSLGSDGGGAAVTLFSDSCSQVTGEWTLDLRENAAQFSIDTRGPASLLAFRTPEAGTAALEHFRSELWQLEEDISNFNFAVSAGGPLDRLQLALLLDRSEELAASVPVARACADERTGADYASMVTGYVRELIGIALDHRDGFDIVDFLSVAGAGYRSGALGPGAPDPAASQAAALRAAVLAELDAVIAEHDTTTLLATAVIARQYGWEDVVTKAVAGIR